MAIIEIDGLGHVFADGRVGLSGVTLTIERGSFVLLAGANGAGKSTLLKHLNGLLLPSSGEVRVAGVSVAADPRRARSLVGMVFQDADSQIVGETVRDDVAFGPENLGWPRRKIDAAVDAALDLLGLQDLAERSPHLLSGGEKRRLAIAGVLAMEPEVIVLDEPFANLDYRGIRQVLGHLVALHASGRTLVVCVHDLEKVLAHGQRLLLIDQGRIVADGEPQLVAAGAEPHGVRVPAALRLGGRVESWLE